MPSAAPAFYTPTVAGLLYALGATAVMTAFLVVGPYLFACLPACP